jgi:RNA polymerase sigma factor (sigma-70 family)
MLSPFHIVLNDCVVRQNPHDDDTILWRNFRAGSREALELIYKRHAVRMYHHGLFVCKDPDMVRDSLQELFSRLWSRRNRVSDADCVRAYLYRSLKRMLLVQIMRNRKRNLSLDDSMLGELSQPFEQSIIDGELEKEQVQRIRNSMRNLTKHQREAILLRYFNSLSYVQIAEVMDLRVESVYNLVSKAIEELRNELQISPPVAA